jgi:hypothetical protein
LTTNNKQQIMMASRVFSGQGVNRYLISERCDL